MPAYWYNRRTIEDMSAENAEFNLSILADKKPYFMRYIYPDLMKQYNTFIKNTNSQCLRKFRCTIDDLVARDEDELSTDELDMLTAYRKYMPVGMHDCVMNRICRRFEEEFDHYFSKDENAQDFDYSIMKSDTEYTVTQYRDIQGLYKQYRQIVKERVVRYSDKRRDDWALRLEREILKNEFRADAGYICSNGSQLSNVILDVCYKTKGSRMFCWDICGDDIIENLLNKNDRRISFPKQDDEGDIEYNGKKFSFVEMRVE